MAFGAMRYAYCALRAQKEKFAIGEHGFTALAFDAEGNIFGLHSMK